MEVINLSASNSILNQYIKELRSVDIQKDSMRFRRNIARIGNIMAYEISKRMAYENDKVTTPLGVADVPVIADQVVLGTILRAWSAGSLMRNWGHCSIDGLTSDGDIHI